MKLQIHTFKIPSTEQISSSTSNREETVQPCHSVHPVRWLHHSAVMVLVLLISSPWLQLLTEI